MDVKQPRYIDIEFKADGTSTIETSGFVGAVACRAASRPFEQALGTVQADTLTAEGRVTPVPEKATVAARNAPKLG